MGASMSSSPKLRGGTAASDRVSTIGDFDMIKQNNRVDHGSSNFDYCNAHYTKVGSSNANCRSSFIGSLNWRKLSSTSKKKNLWMRLVSRLSGKFDNHHHHQNQHPLHHHPHSHPLQQQQGLQQQQHGRVIVRDEDLENNNENRYSAYMAPTYQLKNLSSGVCPWNRTPVSTIAYTDRILKEITKTTNNNNNADYPITKVPLSIVLCYIVLYYFTLYSTLFNSNELDFIHCILFQTILQNNK